MFIAAELLRNGSSAQVHLKRRGVSMDTVPMFRRFRDSSAERDVFASVMTWVGIALLAAILITLSLPMYGQMTPKAIRMKASSDAKQIGLACREYATDNAGVAPRNLDDLELDHPYVHDLVEKIRDTGPEGRLKYLVSFGTVYDELPPENLILRFRVDDEATVVVRADLSTEIVDTTGRQTF